MTADHRTAETERLLLTAAGPDDLEPMFALHGDPRVWSHFPSGRHRDRDRTRTFLDVAAEQWSTDGLGYWVCRLARPLGELGGSEVVGIGGCAVPPGQDRWNLYYRFRPEAQGRGLVGELCATATAAARELAPDRPVTAFLVEHNTASRRAAERAGLTLRWRGPDVDDPDRKAVRLVLADRPLEPEVLERITGGGR